MYVAYGFVTEEYNVWCMEYGILQHTEGVDNKEYNCLNDNICSVTFTVQYISCRVHSNLDIELSGDVQLP